MLLNSFIIYEVLDLVAFIALTLLVGWQEGHLARKKNMGGWWMWAMVSPDGVAPSRMVNVSAAVNLPLHHKVQKFSSGTGSPGWSRKRGHKTVVVVVVMRFWHIINHFISDIAVFVLKRDVKLQPTVINHNISVIY